jgi:hypothetical protein
MFLTPTRYKHFAAMILIGDGVMALLRPRQDALAWKQGPKLWQNLMHRLHERPAVTRAIGVAQVVGGIYWAIKQEPHVKIEG